LALDMNAYRIKKYMVLYSSFEWPWCYYYFTAGIGETLLTSGN
jgi:acetate kinase